MQKNYKYMSYQRIKESEDKKYVKRSDQISSITLFFQNPDHRGADGHNSRCTAGNQGAQIQQLCWY